MKVYIEDFLIVSLSSDSMVLFKGTIFISKKNMEKENNVKVK
jgi:hypothetical protein